MTTYTVTGPDGKDYSIDGPAGATQEQVVAQIQKNMPTGGAHGGVQPPSGLGDLWNRALSNLPQTVQKQAAALLPAWGHNDPSYSPYKPAQPDNMPNDAINPVGNDAQMVGATVAAGGLGGMAAIGKNMLDRAQAAKPPGPIPNVPQANVSQMPTQGSYGAQMAQNTGQAPSSPIPTQPGHMSAANYRQMMGLTPPGSSNPMAPMTAPVSTLPQTLGSIGHGVSHILPFPFNHLARTGLNLLGV